MQCLCEIVIIGSHNVQNNIFLFQKFGFEVIHMKFGIRCSFVSASEINGLSSPCLCIFCNKCKF